LARLDSAKPELFCMTVRATTTFFKTSIPSSDELPDLSGVDDRKGLVGLSDLAEKVRRLGETRHRASGRVPAVVLAFPVAIRHNVRTAPGERTGTPR
jgi:hypothetical protein